MHNSSQVYQFIVIKIWFFFKWDKRWQHNSRTKKGIEFWKKNAKKSMFWHLCVPNFSLGWQLVWLQSTFEVKLSILSTIYALCSFYAPIFSLNSLKSLKILIFFLKEHLLTKTCHEYEIFDSRLCFPYLTSSNWLKSRIK